jgi:hypothetical protein
MRPIRITGITGTSPPVPLDVYVTDSKTLARMTGPGGTIGTGVVEMTLDDILDPKLPPVWLTAPMLAKAPGTGLTDIPEGIRAIRGTGMVPTDVLVISQQGIT